MPSLSVCCGRLPVPPLDILEGQGCGSLGGGGSEGGVCDSFSHASSPFRDSTTPGFVLPPSIKGEALQGEIQALLQKGAVEPASPSPGYYSRMFVVPKSPGGWRHIIDLSTLNKLVVQTLFHMETSRSVLRAVRQGDWMMTIDLKDAYLQVLIHPSSRIFLRFTVGGRA